VGNEETTMRIVVADPDPLSRKKVGSYLKSRGHDVFEAELGTDVLALLKQQAPDLIITDLFLQEMDGIELIQAIRSQSDLPIVATAGAAHAGPCLRAARLLGASACLLRPYSMGELEAILTSVGPP
jgi:two-component system KDP operon response regulator KdpE